MTWAPKEQEELIQIFERYKSLGGCCDMQLLQDLSLFYSKAGVPGVEGLGEFFKNHAKRRDVDTDIQRCSFCGARRDTVAHLIASSTNSFTSANSELPALICNECVALCNQIIGQADSSEPTKSEHAGAPAPD